MTRRITVALGAMLLPLIVAAQAPAATEPSKGGAGGFAPEVARAEDAVRDLQGELGKRLAEALRDGGPGAAIAVCRDEAPKLTAEIAARNGIRLGRTSDRLRNPRNAPPAWAVPYLSAMSGKRTREVSPQVVDLGHSIGVLRPIEVRSACTSCHGAPGQLARNVKEALGRLYPSDHATGYAEGDLRGFFWAEVPRR